MVRLVSTKGIPLADASLLDASMLSALLRADLTPANANVGGKQQKIGGTSHVYALEERQQI